MLLPLIDLLIKTYCLLMIFRILVPKEDMATPLGAVLQRAGRGNPLHTFVLLSFAGALIPALFPPVSVATSLLWNICGMITFYGAFFVVCIIAGSRVYSEQTGIPLYVQRVGGYWVRWASRFTKARGNALVAPAVLLVAGGTILLCCAGSFLLSVAAHQSSLLSGMLVIVVTLIFSFIFAFFQLYSFMVIAMILRLLTAKKRTSPAFNELIDGLTTPLFHFTKTQTDRPGVAIFVSIFIGLVLYLIVWAFHYVILTTLAG